MLQQLEEPIHPKQKKKVLEAIHSLGLKVVPAEVAAAADLPVLVAVQELNRVATDTNAHLEVSEAGNVTYVFDPRFEQSYALSGPRNVFGRVGRVLSNAFLAAAKVAFLAAFFVLRISFGILLIASVVILIVVAVMALLQMLAGSSSDSGGSSGDGGGSSDGDLSGLFDAGSSFDSRPFWLYWAFDWLWDWTYYGDYLWGRPYYSPYGYGYSSLPNYYDNFSYSTVPAQNAEPPKTKKKSKFLDNCFTLLFGDGDPNAKFEEKRWRTIAQVIQHHQGVVVSEQLAPYLDAQSENEDWMLPVLLRFNGIPDVTEGGHIIYSFPAFQEHVRSQPSPPAQENTAAPSDADQLRALYTGHLKRQKIINQSEMNMHAVESYLIEENWVLGKFESQDLWAIFGFAGCAMVGSLALLMHSAAMPLLHVLTPLLLAICAYGSLFFVVPAIRSAINAQMNQRIDARNEKRLEFAARLSSASADMLQKLEEARSAAIHALAGGNDKLAYTTEKDSLEQRFQ